MNVVIGNDRTRGFRVEVNPLVFVNFPEQSAFILNLSEHGMAIQAMEILEPGHAVPFSFPLPGSENEVQGIARIVWSDRSGRAGLQFVRLSEFDRLNLAQWVIKNSGYIN